MLKYPFEVSFDEIERDTDIYVSSVFSSLGSEFLVLPRGPGFIEYPAFEGAYERLKRVTGGFTDMSPETVLPLTVEKPLALVVLRSMLGFTPSEWAYITSTRTGTKVTQSFARSLDRKARLQTDTPLRTSGVTPARLGALVKTACELLAEGAPVLEEQKLHRLDKADTKSGLSSLQRAAGIGLPYAVVLYERFLGRPFAAHRDSVSELVGAELEAAIEDVLSQAGVSFRKTKRAERIEGFDQAPDFVVPSEFNPQVVIEAKIAQDDGTARDKVTRVQHLRELSLRRKAEGKAEFEVVACVGGRGFAVRREDMKKMLLATRGKVFTRQSLDRLVDASRLRDFRTR